MRAPRADAALTLPDALTRAREAHNGGDLVQAERLYRTILRIQPDHPDALYLLSIVECQRGRHVKALLLIDRLLAKGPGFAEALYNRGTILYALGRFAEALASHDRALALRPDYAYALHNRGLTLSALKRFDEALASYDRALALTPDHAETHFGRGYVLFELGLFDEALASYDRALALRPDHAVAYNNRGNTLRQLGRYKAALASFDRALTLRPNYAQAHTNRGIVLKDLDRLDEAIASYDRALAIRPDLPDALNNRGLALQELKRFAEAVASFDRAIRLDPEHADHRFNRSALLLLLGNFDDGWREYEWRRRQKAWVERKLKGPEWSGEHISGKRIFLYSEQGFGDTIQFARFARSVAMLGAKVALGVSVPLESLLRRLDCDAVLVRNGEKLPDFDLHLPLMSVPFILGFAPDRSPAEVPYLSADPALVDLWSSRLPVDGFRVGIAWQGKPSAPIDKGRSVPLKAFAPLGSIPGVRLISLQKDADTEQFADLPAGMTVETLRDGFDLGPDAFLDTAAVMMNLDLVVTSDTAIAHLAGALGRPVWIALRHVPDWRWMLDREDSPWYPTARLFRQRRAGDWDEVFTRMAEELARLAASSRTGPIRQQRDQWEIDRTALIPVSFGELIDKISILTIKLERMGVSGKIANVRRELELLNQARLHSIGNSPDIRELEDELKRVNEKLWDIEDDLRDCEQQGNFGPAFIDLARAVYKTNDRRSALKRRINEVAGSALIEEKLYHRQSDPRPEGEKMLPAARC